MKTGRTIQEVAQVVEHQRDTARDFVADSRKLTLANDGNSLILDQIISATVNSWAHQQIGARVEIPRPYYERMRESAPALLASNVNHWFHAKEDTRMVRTIDEGGRPIVRAFLGRTYRPLDNYGLMEAVLPELVDSGCKVESCEVTEQRLYIKATTARIQGEVKRGDVVQAGVVVSNSEVGAGSLNVEPLVFRLSCTNGMIAPDYAFKRRHVGRGHKGADDGAGVSEFFTDETKRADDRALFLKVRDTVRGVMSEDGFRKILDNMKAAAGDKSTAPPQEIVERTAKRFSLSEAEGQGVMRHLIEGGDLSRWGLLNAVTRTAQDLPNYDRATELERLGGQILELPRQDWKQLAELN